MGEIVDQVQDTNSRINQRMQEEEVTTTEKTIPAVTMNNPNPVLGNKTSIVGPGLEKAKRNRVAKTVTTGKVSSVADSIAKMEEKITLLKYVDSIKVPEVPTGLTKDGRETLLQIGKDVEALKGRIIAAIQKS